MVYFSKPKEMSAQRRTSVISRRLSSQSSGSHLTRYSMNHAPVTTLPYNGCTKVDTPSHDVGSHASDLSRPAIFPSKFDMYLYTEDQNTGSQFIQKFTELSPHPQRSDYQLAELQDLLQDFPDRLDMNELSTNNNILFVEVSLSLTKNIPKGASLAVDLTFRNDSCTANDFGSFESDTWFYDGDEDTCVDGRIIFDAKSRKLYKIPFGSKFWAAKFFKIGKMISHASTISDIDTRFELMESAKAQVERIKAVQVLYGVPEDLGERTNLLTILWTFKAAEDNHAGVATWMCLASSDSTIKDEIQDSQSYGSLSLNLSNSMLVNGAQPSDQSHFDFNDISSIGLAGIPSGIDIPQAIPEDGLPPENNIDFIGGHIDICLEPAVLMEGYTDLADNAVFDVMSSSAQQWQSYGNPYEQQHYDIPHFAQDHEVPHDEDGLGQADYLGEALQQFHERDNPLGGLHST
ncbi:hypothetical protein M501DRAFT_787537 [Patellaria atrata CBS 101060]|uniref:Uncharacterized protein n=1 Tax=Patellaria atrata CBS 101060 TaxID=1346257 RepID=A0A9P4SB58_9PEZI|nr:hypothetical protein M501DRAFT_787537 [Patellaria atrata CBS 101060]